MGRNQRTTWKGSAFSHRFYGTFLREVEITVFYLTKNGLCLHIAFKSLFLYMYFSIFPNPPWRNVPWRHNRVFIPSCKQGNWPACVRHSYIGNRKHFPCFHTSESLKVLAISSSVKLPRAVSITWELGNFVFYFFYKITLRKLKRGNSLLYRSLNYPCNSMFMMTYAMASNGVKWTFPCFPHIF